LAGFLLDDKKEKQKRNTRVTRLHYPSVQPLETEKEEKTTHARDPGLAPLRPETPVRPKKKEQIPRRSKEKQAESKARRTFKETELLLKFLPRHIDQTLLCKEKPPPLAAG
jgi:hypothetical protein